MQEFPDRVTVKMQALKGKEGESPHGHEDGGARRQQSGREEGEEEEEEEEEQDGGGGGEAEAGVQEFPDSITAKMQALRGRLSRVSQSGNKSVFDEPSASETSAGEGGGRHLEGAGRSYSGGPGGYKEDRAGGGGGGWVVDEDEEHDKGFGGPGKEGVNGSGGGRGEERRGVYDDIDESFTAGGCGFRTRAWGLKGGAGPVFCFTSVAFRECCVFRRSSQRSGTRRCNRSKEVCP